MKNQSSRKRIKNWLIFWVVFFWVKLFSRLSHSTAVIVGAWLGQVAWFFGGSIRRRTLSHLQRVHPHWSPKKRHKVARCCAIQLGKNALECIIMNKKSSPNAPKQMVRFAHGALQTLQTNLSLDRGLIYVTAHLGNWELMAKEVANLAPVTVLYKPSYDQRFTQMIERFREKNKVEGISVAEIGHVKKAINALKERKILGILLDQPVPKGIAIPFLGQTSLVSPLVGFLARVTNAPIVVGYIHRVQACQHAIAIQNIKVPKQINQAQDITLLVLQAIEYAISRHPTQWIWSLENWRSAEFIFLSRTLQKKNALSIEVKQL